MQKNEYVRNCVAVITFGLLSSALAATGITKDGSGNDILTIDGSDYELTSDLTVYSVVFKTSHKVFGDYTLSASNNMKVQIAGVTATVDSPVGTCPYIYVDKGATINFNKLVTYESQQGNISGVVNYNGGLKQWFWWYQNDPSASGEVYFNAGGCNWGHGQWDVRPQHFYLNCKDAWCTNPETGDATYYGVIQFKQNGIVDCCGFDQHFNQINPTEGKTGTFHSADKATAYFMGKKGNVHNYYTSYTGNSTFYGQFTGKLSAVFLGAGTTNTLTGASTTVGTLTASNGAQVVLSGSGHWAADVVASCGGQVRVSTSGAFDNKATVHVFGETAKGVKSKVIVDAGVIAKVGYLKVGETTYDEIGSYGTTASGADHKLDDWFEGGGVLYVTRGTDVGANIEWTGNGADRNVKTAANWAAADPDYSSGLSAASFTGGTGVDLDTKMTLKGAAFSAAGDFEIAQAGGGSLSVGGDGLVLSAHDGASRTLRFGVPYVGAAQTLSVPTAGDRLVFDGGLVCASDGATLTKTGPGDVYLESAMTAPCSLEIQGGKLNVRNSAELTSGTSIAIYPDNGVQIVITNENPTIASAVSLVGMVDDASSAVVPVALPENTTIRFLQPVALVPTTANSSAVLPVPNDSTLILEQGMTFNSSMQNGFYLKGGTNYTFVVRGQPMKCNGGFTQMSGTLRLEASGNYSNWGFNSYGGVFQCACLNAVNFPSHQHTFGYDNGYCTTVVDLGGFDQRFSLFMTRKSSKAKPGVSNVVTSASFAYLHENEKKLTASTYNAIVWPRTNTWTFTGKAGYFREGPDKLFLGMHSPSEGGLTVTNGTLAIASDASWSNACEVVVSHAGRFELTAAHQVGKQAVWRVSGADARVDIPAGVVQKCLELYLDGERCYETCGGVGSGAQHEDARFTGAGILRPKPVGCVLLVR